VRFVRQSGSYLMGRHGAAPAVAGGDVLRDSVTLMAVKALGRIGHGLFLACKGRLKSSQGRQLGLRPQIRVGTYGIRSVAECGISDSTMDGSPSLKQRRNRRDRQVYNLGEPTLRFSSG
jgi:hypothetical protein